jgi:hypothetical protein
VRRDGTKAQLEAAESAPCPSKIAVDTVILVKGFFDRLSYF